MSEYQCYEFAAIDRPVTRAESEYPWQVSTRAQVTPWRWRNVYNYGDFRGSVQRMMEVYDAHLYVSNWGVYRFALAFPQTLLTAQTVQPYLVDDRFDVEESAGRVVLTWTSSDDDPDDEWLDESGLLDSLLVIREEILRGDWRALYLGWLGGWCELEDDDEAKFEREPPVPPGLNKLSAAQRALSELMAVDPDLLQAAAELKVPVPDQAASLRQCIQSLSAEQVTDYLLRVASGEGMVVSAELNSLERASCQPASGPRRTRGELQEAARRCQQIREEREAKAQEQRRLKKAAKRNQFLEELLQRADANWHEADKLASLKKSSAYEEAAKLLRDLRDAYDLAGQSELFQQKLAQFRQTCSRQNALIARIKAL